MEFVIAIAEPVSRPRFIHEYVVTDVSLHSAVALGLSGAVIVKKLDLLCKTILPPTLVRFITNSTRHAGKLRLVLFNSRYSLETSHLQIMEEVTRLPSVRAMIEGDMRTRSAAPPPPQQANTNNAMPLETGYLEGVAAGLMDGSAGPFLQPKLAWQKEFDRDDAVATTALYFAMLLPGKERDVVKICRELGYPLVEVGIRRVCIMKLMSRLCAGVRQRQRQGHRQLAHRPAQQQRAAAVSGALPRQVLCRRTGQQWHYRPSVWRGENACGCHSSSNLEKIDADRMQLCCGSHAVEAAVPAMDHPPRERYLCFHKWQQRGLSRGHNNHLPHDWPP